MQVGAFRNKNNALKLADRLKVIFDYVDVSVHDARIGEGTLYKVRVSKSKTLNKAG
ncbi:MAG: SPOR domain-containing protein, partial [Deltaproteobacteria bacterium]|nr:SPOR domain-containing protein [Deltaproteobacteria bacterium]